MTLRLTTPATGLPAGVSGDSEFQRAAYYPGQFLTDRDLTADQAYAAEKRQVQNRLLHGHGVVCGLAVTPADQAGWVTVRPGLALDPYGNELRVLENLPVDLRAKMEEAMRRRAQSAVVAASVRPSVLIALRYEERPVDPQPAFLPQTSTDAPAKPARTREGYRLALLLEQELDAVAKQALYWQTDLLSAARRPSAVLTAAEVECSFVFLARVTDLGDGYQVDTTVQRPVVNPELFFELVRLYAPELFLGGPAAPAVRDAIAAQVGQLYSPALAGKLADKGITVTGVKRIGGAPAPQPEHVSVVVYVDAGNRVLGAGPAPAAAAGPSAGDLLARFAAPLYRAAQRALAGLDIPPLQEAVTLAVAAAAVYRLPLSLANLPSLTGVEEYLSQHGITTVGGVVDVWSDLGPTLGRVAPTALQELQQIVQQVAQSVKAITVPACAVKVADVPVTAVAEKLGVSLALAGQMLAAAQELAQ